MRQPHFVVLGLVVFSVAGSAQPSAKTFDMYIVDTEGGHAVLYVSPTGESLLEDTGNPGGRDTDRIMEAIHAAGVKRIDHLILTHYHVDHVGGLEELAKRIEIKHFIDHGKTAEEREQVRDFQAKYAELYSKTKHTVVKPGDKIPFGPVDVEVVTSARQVIKTPLKGGGIPNPACAEFKARDDSDTQAENKESGGGRLQLREVSVGESRRLHIQRGASADVSEQSDRPRQFVPHVASRDQSVELGGVGPRTRADRGDHAQLDAQGRRSYDHASPLDPPGLQDLWQLHWAYAAGLDYNTPGLFIANPEDPATVAGVITGAIPAGFGGVGGGRGRGNAPGATPAGGAPPAAGTPPNAVAPPAAGGPPQGGPGGPGGGFGGGPGRGGHNGPAFYIKVSTPAEF
jgi:hypothetical protein